ncbi:FeS assembly ATPase SufC [Caldisphaera lagunensis DSM 15908]|uniref:FeS assembly ATPase SufC n=1 Tax=Caldisphaera lagunensis (strain DSM 15908 / JCM 11604 / ANMR 0165 / IC-154) TaxID=1056495 RepID=L0ABX6_CALLD|nr:Fe-S cluster assembly ATPase SufC [Caldisphaera lagunensis]AFZ70617.1 FeS assembly ATPase SufC [Caldisphaera lagunensis DSM 15908]
MALETIDLTVNVGEKQILNNMNLKVEKGEALILMGPNGSGKTTLAFSLLGHPKYQINKGKILLDNNDITDLPTYQRALMGLGLAFQNPVEVPGLMLSMLINAISMKRNKSDFDISSIDPKLIIWARNKAKELGLVPSILEREVNVGFSGGEKKRSEMLQMLVMDPKYIIFDEPDSGLDVDGIRIIGELINSLRNSGKGILIITHHAEITKFVYPDKVIVISKGKIVDEGGEELIKKIEEYGYKDYEEVQ